MKVDMDANFENTALPLLVPTDSVFFKDEGILQASHAYRQLYDAVVMFGSSSKTKYPVSIAIFLRLTFINKTHQQPFSAHRQHP